jgi:hypothetical protein
LRLVNGIGESNKIEVFVVIRRKAQFCSRHKSKYYIIVLLTENRLKCTAVTALKLCNRNPGKVVALPSLTAKAIAFGGRNYERIDKQDLANRVAGLG